MNKLNINISNLGQKGGDKESRIIKILLMTALIWMLYYVLLLPGEALLDQTMTKFLPNASNLIPNDTKNEFMDGMQECIKPYDRLMLGFDDETASASSVMTLNEAFGKMQTYDTNVDTASCLIDTAQVVVSSLITKTLDDLLEETKRQANPQINDENLEKGVIGEIQKFGLNIFNVFA